MLTIAVESALRWCDDLPPRPFADAVEDATAHAALILAAEVRRLLERTCATCEHWREPVSFSDASRRYCGLLRGLEARPGHFGCTYHRVREEAV